MCCRAGTRDFDRPNGNLYLEVSMSEQASPNLSPSQTPIEGFFLLINAHERVILIVYFQRICVYTRKRCAAVLEMKEEKIA